MKSKIYSSRYMKISSKGMIWIPAFVTIGFLLAFPVTELIMLGNWFGMEYTAEQIRALVPVNDIIINYVGPVIGAHSGPGTVALFFLGRHR